MQNFKVTLSVLLVVTTSFTGCRPVLPELSYTNQPATAKSYNNIITATAFLGEIPRISQELEDLRKFTAIKSIRIYKATFKETFVEDQNTLVPALLSPTSSVKGVDYLPFKGDFQELYLLRLRTEIPEQTPFIYISIKYDALGNCIGLGPAYLGYLNNQRNKPVLDIDLRMAGRKIKSQYKLVKARKAQLRFIFQNPITENQMVIDRILVEEENKIGGIKPITYAVNDIFDNSNALEFNYVGELNFIE